QEEAGKGSDAMLTEERHEKIMRLVNTSGAVSVQDLVGFLNISESTVRRDLLTLDREGRLRRVHGGATTLRDDSLYEADMENLQDKYSIHMSEKRRIAQYAARLIHKEDFVYLDAGSTTEQLVDFLAGSEASFVTNSIPLAQKLGRIGGRVYIVPGRVKGDTEAIVGSEMRDMIGRYHFTKGFFGANGVAVHSGCTTPDEEEAVCKRAAMGQCLDRFVLADSSKFGLSSHITFAELSMVTLITARDDESLDYKPYQQMTEVHIL
ncbi:DeoR/GlpR family DNA-binding transcription regulator, partial [Megasphaera sp.]